MLRARLTSLAGASALAIAIVATAAPAGLAAPAAPTAGSDSGLFGSQDPTYDGVYRQAYALLGLTSAKARVPGSAITWLLDQQCADGSFMSYRADTSVPCPPSDPATYSGPDANSTALAALALEAVGEQRAAKRAATWLLTVRTAGGGVTYYLGGTPDSVSTGLALAAWRTLPQSATARKAATNFERRMVYGCASSASDRGGMPYMSGSLPDAMSTSQSLLGLAGAFPIRERSQRGAVPSLTCDSGDRVSDAKSATAHWLARTINANDGALPDPFTPGASDWNSTAQAILGLVAARTGGKATSLAVSALIENIEEYVGSDSGDRPAALGTASMVAVATGANPRNFAGRDLIADLLATRQR